MLRIGSGSAVTSDEQLAASGGLSATNLAHLRVKRLARLGRDGELLRMAGLADVVVANPPVPVKDAVLAAIYTHTVAEPLSQGDLATAREKLIDAGPLNNYASDGVYQGFRDLGFFVIRKGDKLIALSSYCTHQKCELKAERDHSFYCRCHGSTFDPGGKVTEGPATRNLPALPTINQNGHLLVKVTGT